MGKQKRNRCKYCHGRGKILADDGTGIFREVVCYCKMPRASNDKLAREFSRAWKSVLKNSHKKKVEKNA